MTGLNSLSKLVNLTNLDVSNNKISNIKPLATIKGIKELNICNNDISSLEGI
ncbi:leucine-rich repeat domain-containing protein, partial [Clostridium senegalense]|uniref:leucine-rich repeat domain-containing protein n=1 Tax=Clostridium senegalense TaxID=1465809 RepID=UPI00399D7424